MSFCVLLEDDNDVLCHGGKLVVADLNAIAGLSWLFYSTYSKWQRNASTKPDLQERLLTNSLASI
jgi:hypothetical protein